MYIINENASTSAVLDLQNRLVLVGLMKENEISGKFDSATTTAVEKFATHAGIESLDGVSRKLWEELVSETYQLGDRTLYLRIPNFKGSDCRKLQKILGTLGFSVGEEDGVFGVLTEAALRRYQQNMGLPSDGIVGAYTYQSLQMLEHAWSGKEAHKGQRTLGLARVADVLESHAVCIFGKSPFTRSIANRMSNLALATTYASRIVSAEDLSVTPDENMILFEIAMSEDLKNKQKNLDVVYTDDSTLNDNIKRAIKNSLGINPHKLRIIIKNKSWEEAKEERSAQHYAINLLDALCLALEK